MQSNLLCEASSAAATVMLPGWTKSAPRMTPGGHENEQQSVLRALQSHSLISGVGVRHQPEMFHRNLQNRGKPCVKFKSVYIQGLIK